MTRDSLYDAVGDNVTGQGMTIRVGESAYFGSQFSDETGKHLRRDIGEVRLRHLTECYPVENLDCLGGLTGHHLGGLFGFLEFSVGHLAEKQDDILGQVFLTQRGGCNISLVLRS